MVQKSCLGYRARRRTLFAKLCETALRAFTRAATLCLAALFSLGVRVAVCAGIQRTSGTFKRFTAGVYRATRRPCRMKTRFLSRWCRIAFATLAHEYPGEVRARMRAGAECLKRTRQSLVEGRTALVVEAAKHLKPGAATRSATAERVGTVQTLQPPDLRRASEDSY